MACGERTEEGMRQMPKALNCLKLKNRKIIRKSRKMRSRKKNGRRTPCFLNCANIGSRRER
jgi:hypothetical protein